MDSVKENEMEFFDFVTRKAKKKNVMKNLLELSRFDK